MKRRCVRNEEGADEEDADDKMVYQAGNRVYFYAPVSRQSILSLIRRLREAEKAIGSSDIVVADPHIVLFIHSEGGDAYAGLSGMDHIRNSRIPIHTVSDGFVASAATFLLLGGSKRFTLPHSSILIHQLTTSFWGKYADLIDEMENSHQLMETIKSIYKQFTTMKTKKLNSLLKKELTMSASECVEYGVVSGVL